MIPLRLVAAPELYTGGWPSVPLRTAKARRSKPGDGPRNSLLQGSELEGTPRNLLVARRTKSRHLAWVAKCWFPTSEHTCNDSVLRLFLGTRCSNG